MQNTVYKILKSVLHSQYVKNIPAEKEKKKKDSRISGPEKDDYGKKRAPKKASQG